MTSSQYYKYIESLATAHALVAHSSTNKHFYRGELEEFYMDLRNRVKFPAVIAESYETYFDGNNRTMETSFIIAQNYPRSKDWDEINKAFDYCGLIGDEFLRRMMDDGDNGEICATIEPVSAVPVLNEQCLYAGWRYTIRLTHAFDEEPDPDMWSDMDSVFEIVLDEDSEDDTEDIDTPF